MFKYSNSYILIEKCENKWKVLWQDATTPETLTQYFDSKVLAITEDTFYCKIAIQFHK